MIKRIPVKKEPILHTHRYTVLIYRPNGENTAHSCDSLRECTELIEKCVAGTVAEIHRITTNFIKKVEKV